MTAILDWLADYGLILAGVMMVISCVCFIVMIVLIIQAQNDFINSDYYFERDDDEDDARCRRDETIMIASVAVMVACM